jgi:hypothetical protein
LIIGIWDYFIKIALIVTGEDKNSKRSRRLYGEVKILNRKAGIMPAFHFCLDPRTCTPITPHSDSPFFCACFYGALLVINPNNI